MINSFEELVENCRQALHFGARQLIEHGFVDPEARGERFVDQRTAGIRDDQSDMVSQMVVETLLVNDDLGELVAHLCAAVSTEQTGGCFHAFNVFSGVWEYEGVTINDVPDSSAAWEWEGNSWTSEFKNGAIHIVVTP